jgi:biotin synthase
MPTLDWNDISDRLLDGGELRRDEAEAIVASDDRELLPILQAAYRIRESHHGRRVRVHVLRNAKSGRCPENCSFCSQSAHFHADIPEYALQSVDELVQGADDAVAMGAVTYCMVTATRGPRERELATVIDATRQIRRRHPNLRICTSLGLLQPGQAERLAEAGVGRYNHNLETSERFFPEVCSTHTFEDRAETVRSARAAGMEACCGGILGLGEEREDWIDLAFALRDLGVESIPVNFLDPRPGTPLGESGRLTPRDALRGLALMRLANPRAIDIRVAGGRETTLGSLQPLALWAANSMFTNGYLTTPGEAPSRDHAMILEAGFEPEELAD